VDDCFVFALNSSSCISGSRLHVDIQGYPADVVVTVVHIYIYFICPLISGVVRLHLRQDANLPSCEEQ
jgi:hypothetical protein